jgi:hypothetical protein
MDAIMFYMKAASLNHQTKLLRKIMENAHNAIGNFHCYLWMLKLNPYLSVDRIGTTHNSPKAPIKPPKSIEKNDQNQNGKFPVSYATPVQNRVQNEEKYGYC